MRPKWGQESHVMPAINEMILKRSLEEIPLGSPRWYSRIFTVPKSSGGLRTVIDLSALNRYIIAPKFKLTTPKEVIQGLEPGQWAASIDLRDAYLQVPIHRNSRKYLRVHWRGRTYQFRSLPFGLSSAPWVYTKLVKRVQKHLQSKGVRIFCYLDDWLVVANSKAECKEALDKTLALIRQLGFIVNLEKSQLTPSQRFTYLGMHFDLTQALVRPAQARVQKLREAVLGLLTGAPRSARSWSQVLGHGCQPSGLGSTCRRFSESRELVSSRGSSPHKSPGTVSGSKGLQTLQKEVRGSSCVVVNGQLHSKGLFAQLGGTRSPTLSNLAAQILTWVQAQGMILSVSHLAGSLNVVADALSRQDKPVDTEWTLAVRVANQVRALMGSPNVDLFATRFNTMCPVFVSPFQDDLAWGWTLYL
ncbi:uncharacterized protein LOC141909147 [Tubulanus polymorphus]|uniref:uncharacterized protein LOC141909147 n=1 Tax=Tubulanus polymorphus TaxID=672921 RepID=UPI003DA56FBD